MFWMSSGAATPLSVVNLGMPADLESVLDD